MIQQLDFVLYPDESRPWWTETSHNPGLELVIEKLASMDRHCRPLLYLCQTAANQTENVLQVMGGNGLYFIEVADDQGFWHTPFDPQGTDQEIDIWTSDQRNSVEHKYTWQLDDAQSIVEHYFHTGAMSTAYNWKNVKQM
jgi:hypothetical protein